MLRLPRCAHKMRYIHYHKLVTSNLFGSGAVVVRATVAKTITKISAKTWCIVALRCWTKLLISSQQLLLERLQKKKRSTMRIGKATTANNETER